MYFLRRFHGNSDSDVVIGESTWSSRTSFGQEEAMLGDGLMVRQSDCCSLRSFKSEK